MSGRRERPEPDANDALEYEESKLKDSIEFLSDRAAERYEDEMRRRW